MDVEVSSYIKYHEEQHKSDSRALRLQAGEYERRLNELNHAHQRAEEAQGKFVSLQVYEGVIRDLRALIVVQGEELNAVQNESSRNKEQIASLQATLIWLTRTLVAAVVVGAIALLVRMIVGAAP